MTKYLICLMWLLTMLGCETNQLPAVDRSQTIFYRDLQIGPRGELVAIVADTQDKQGANRFSNGYIVVSSNHGSSWKFNSPSEGGGLKFLQLIESMVYVRDDDQRLFKSFDYGRSWEPDKNARDTSSLIFNRVEEGRRNAIDFNRKRFSSDEFGWIHQALINRVRTPYGDWLIAVNDTDIFVLAGDKLFRGRVTEFNLEEVHSNNSIPRFNHQFRLDTKGNLYITSNYSLVSGMAHKENRRFIFMSSDGGQNWNQLDFGFSDDIGIDIAGTTRYGLYYRVNDDEASRKQKIANKVFFSSDGAHLEYLPFDDIDLIRFGPKHSVYVTRKSSPSIWMRRSAYDDFEELTIPVVPTFTKVRERDI